LLVEQPGQKAAAKSQQIKAVAANQARPITADEIQKAKLRAQLMQSYKTKSEYPKKPSLLTNDFLSASEAYLRPKLEAQKKARVLPPKISKQVDSLSDQKPNFGPKESLLDKCQRVQIPWRAPPGTVPLSLCWILLLLFKLFAPMGHIHRRGCCATCINSLHLNEYGIPLRSAGVCLHTGIQLF